MRNTAILIMCLFVVGFAKVKQTGFICTLDGTCFVRCVEKNIPMDMCKLQCTICDWR